MTLNGIDQWWWWLSSDYQWWWWWWLSSFNVTKLLLIISLSHHTCYPLPPSDKSVLHPLLFSPACRYTNPLVVNACTLLLSCRYVPHLNRRDKSVLHPLIFSPACRYANPLMVKACTLLLSCRYVPPLNRSDKSVLPPFIFSPRVGMLTLSWWRRARSSSLRLTGTPRRRITA